MITTRQVRAARVTELLLPALAIGLLVVFLGLYFQRGFIPGDAFTYLAAGERLNAGHFLYALLPGDRPVGLNPPYWTVPFLSPPFIAVMWRPLAALPSELGVYLWWAGTIAAIAIVVGALMRRRPVLTSAALIALVVPVTYEIGVGNVNAFLLAGAVGVWLLVREARTVPAGLLVAVMTAVKLTPLPLAGWVIGTGGRRGLVAVAAGAAACLVVSLVGAGLDTHLEYLSIARATGSTGLSDLSLGGLARDLGLPDPIPTLIPTAILVGGTAAATILPARGRVTAGFAVAILAWTFGSPVVNINTPILLLALLAPVVWPWPQDDAASST